MNPDYGTPQPPAPGDEQHSTERLAQALLEGVNPLVVDHDRAQLVRRVRAGYYHDFLSPLATPCIQLYRDLHRAGLTDLAERVKNGDFDATKAESDAWSTSPEGRATFEALVNGR